MFLLYCPLCFLYFYAFLKTIKKYTSFFGLYNFILLFGNLGEVYIILAHLYSLRIIFLYVLYYHIWTHCQPGLIVKTQVFCVEHAWEKCAFASLMYSRHILDAIVLIKVSPDHQHGVTWNYKPIHSTGPG